MGDLRERADKRLQQVTVGAAAPADVLQTLADPNTAALTNTISTPARGSPNRVRANTNSSTGTAILQVSSMGPESHRSSANGIRRCGSSLPLK